MAASQEFVNSRVFPIEQSVTKLGESLAELKESMDALKFELASRDGDWAGTKARVDEIGTQIEKLENEYQSNTNQLQVGWARRAFSDIQGCGTWTVIPEIISASTNGALNYEGSWWEKTMAFALH